MSERKIILLVGGEGPKGGVWPGLDGAFLGWGGGPTETGQRPPTPRHRVDGTDRHVASEVKKIGRTGRAEPEA